MTCQRLAGLIVSCLAMAACSVERPTAPPSEKAAVQRVFSDEDRRAARALSISNRSDLVDMASPYMQAITCELALETLAGRMTEMGVLTPAQATALKRVQQDNSRSILETAARESKGEADVARDKAQQRETVSDPIVRFQMGMACLRKQAGGSPGV